MERSLLKTIYYGLAVAMGVAVIVLSIVGTMTAANMGILLGVGVAVLGVAGLQK